MTEFLFALLVLSVAAQRIALAEKSKRHERLLRAAGAAEFAPWQMSWIASTQVAWLVSMMVEVVALRRPTSFGLAAASLAIVAIGQALAWAGREALGVRWTVRVLTLPGAPRVLRGVFRHVRHPVYLGLILEVAALPLVHGAWVTSALFTVANGLLVAVRVATEDAAGSAGARLRRHPK